MNVMTKMSAESATAAPAVMISQDDPIFAAIDKYRAAMLRWFETGKVQLALSDKSKKHKASTEANDGAFRELRRAERKLAATVPGSLEGMHALLSLLEDLGAQRIRLPDRGWFSSPEFMWPIISAHVSPFDNKPIELKLPFFVIQNVREALLKLESKGDLADLSLFEKKVAARSDDRIFAVIEAHKASAVASDISSEGAGENSEILKKEERATADLVRTIPSSQRGLLALLRYTQSALKSHTVSFCYEDEKLTHLLMSIESAARGLITPPPVPRASRSSKLRS